MGRVAVTFLLIAAISSCNAPTAATDPQTAAMREAPVSYRTAVAQQVSLSAASPPTSAPVPESIRDGTKLWEGFDASSNESLPLAGLTRGEVGVYAEPGGEGGPVRILPATTILGTTTVVAAVGQPTRDGWLEVLVPGRPNGGTGWVAVDQLDLFVVTDRIVIDLSERELVYHMDGDERLRSSVAVGTGHNPTPTGLFFVTDIVRIKEGGPWGPAALGLSARSETITEFNGGDGIIGIHGTNKPDSIGRAASLGCVRLPNDVITELRGLVSLGTPVEIKA